MSMLVTDSNRRLLRCASPAHALLVASLLAPTAPGQCNWTELEALGVQPLDAHGATLALGDDWLLIGAPGDDRFGSNFGLVRVYQREPSGWSLADVLPPQSADEDTLFGAALDIAVDVAVVGAPRADGAQPGSGAVHVFEHTAAGWVQSATLTASDAAAGHAFGAAVSVHQDGILVGAPGHDLAGTGAGQAYLFERSGTGWQETFVFSAPTPAAGEAFGAALAFAGGVALIGAPGDDLDGQDAGSVTPYSDHGAGQWSPWGNLTGVAAPHDAFGAAIALDQGGGYGIIGAPGDALSSSAGRAFAVTLTKSGFMFDTGSGPLEGELPPGSRFGAAVAVDQYVEDDFELRYAVGAPGADLGAGRVTTYEALDGWFETASLTPLTPGAAQLGTSVALDGSTVVGGAPMADVEGAVYVCDDLPDFDCGQAYPYCPAIPNSSGNAADIWMSIGLPDEGQMTLFVREAPPGQVGSFFTGTEEVHLPFGDGFFCIGGSPVRLSAPVGLDAMGRAQLVVDLDPPPFPGLFVPFTTWKFQFWFRDPGGPGGTGFNLSDAQSYTFCPR